MNMKQPWLVIVSVALMLSACGDRSDSRSAGSNGSSSSNETNSPSMAQQRQGSAPASSVENPLPARSGNQ
jgi:hypothetical protein